MVKVFQDYHQNQCCAKEAISSLKTKLMFYITIYGIHCQPYVWYLWCQ